MMNTNGAAGIGSSLPAPLRTASDMPSAWADVELDFDAAAERIVRAHADDGAHRDLSITDLRTWAVAPQGGTFALVPLARHHHPKPLRAAAFGNLMTRLGAPGEFIRRLPAPLQLANINYLLAEHDEGSAATLRLRNDEVSAIVSGRYAPLDPVELVETVREGLQRFGILGDVRVRGVASGLVDNLRLILPSEQTAIKPGDVSALGIDITSSSFARSAVHVTPVIWRLVCSNGLKRAERGSGLSFRHVGDTQRLRDGVSEAIPSALVYARGVMDQWRRSVSFMVEDVQKQIDAMRELTIPEKKNIEVAVRLETGRPELPEHVGLYDFVNAMTASAKSGSPSRRLEIETLAGDVLARHVGSA
jgi:hypothetical protein